MRPSAARAARRGIRWREGLNTSRRRAPRTRWGWVVTAALIAAVTVILAIARMA